MEIKSLNNLEKDAYKLILSSPQLKKNLMEELNIPKTTANRILQGLISKGLIKEIGMDLSSGGRPPIIYGPEENTFFTIGIDISRSYSEVIIMNSALKIIFKNRFEMTTNFDPESTVKYINFILKEAFIELKIEKDKIIGIGLGVVDPIDTRSGFLGEITNTVNEEWKELNIKSLFEKYFDFPILLDRGTNFASLGEFFMNLNKKLSKILYLNLGLGIRYGLVSKGEIMNSFDTIYDALGHMTINFDGPKCICGKNGCLEHYGTIKSIENKFLIDKGTHSSIDEIIDLAKTNDIIAKNSIAEPLNILSLGINNFFNITNADKVIINGPLIQKDPYIFEEILKNIEKLNPSTKSLNHIYTTDSIFKESIISAGSAIGFILEYIN